MTTTDLIKCAEREVAMRKRVYRNRVRDGKMEQRTADHEIACMEEIVRRLRDMEQPGLL